MSEERILGAIANYYQDDRLIFQVIVRDTQAHIYINRQAEDEIDYSQVTEDIVTAISNLDLYLNRVYLYSRVLGESEPDWHTDVDLTEIATETTIVDEEVENQNINSNIVEPDFENSNSFLEQDQFEKNSSNDIFNATQNNEDVFQTQTDLISYCFIRNKRLLSCKLVPPKLNIARLIQTFHKFEVSLKAEQLPVLHDRLEPFVSLIE